MRITLAILLLTLASCTPFVQSSSESTTIGLTINHEAAIEWFFNIFSTQESLVLENDKTR